MDVALDLKIETNTEMPWPTGGDSLCDIQYTFLMSLYQLSHFFQVILN